MKQVIIGGYNDALSKTATEHNVVMGGCAWNGTASRVWNVVPTAGTFTRLSVELSGVPGTNPYLITLYVNGSASTLAVTIAADGTTGVDTDTVNVSAGDYIYLESSRPSGNPDNTPTARWSIVFNGTTANESIVMGVNCAYEVSAVYCPLTVGYNNSITTDETLVYQVIPTGGSFKKLYARLSTDPGTDPDAYTLKLRVDGADSDDGSGNPLSLTIVANNTTGNDTTHTIAVVAGNYCNFTIIPVDTPSAYPWVAFGMVFLATTDGESLILGQSSDPPTNNVTNYNYLNTTLHNNVWGTTEYFQGGQDPGDDMVLKNFYVKQSGASGDGNTWTYTVRGGGGSTNLVVAIAGAADTTGSDTNAAHNYTVAAYDDLAIMSVPDSSPTARYVYWGLVCYIAPAANITVTPSTLSLTITSYAPVNQLVIPGSIGSYHNQVRSYNSRSDYSNHLGPFHHRICSGNKRSDDPNHLSPYHNQVCPDASREHPRRPVRDGCHYIRAFDRLKRICHPNHLSSYHHRVCASDKRSDHSNHLGAGYYWLCASPESQHPHSSSL
ncbi:MAG: hypothetical protein WC657_05505 [Candidatus Paceibacterota bacterium]|jgi:hypothetical protein